MYFVCDRSRMVWGSETTRGRLFMVNWCPTLKANKEFSPLLSKNEIIRDTVSVRCISSNDSLIWVQKPQKTIANNLRDLNFQAKATFHNNLHFL